MKRISSFFLMLVFSALSLLAQDAIRYISYSDGRVYAIPQKYILNETEESGVVTLTLKGDETFTYNVNEVTISEEFNSTVNPTLTSYGFTNADNDQVYTDVEATITEDGDRIVVNADVPVIGKRLRPSFELSEGVSLWLGGEKQKSGVSSHRFEEPIVFTLAPENHLMYTVESESNGFVPFGRECEVNVKYLTDYATGTYKIPTVYLTFGDGVTWDNSQWIGMQLTDGTNTKEEWIEGCTFRLDGAGIWPDIDTVEGCEIRGRGNSSWGWSYMSKNPYRIKFPKKQKQSPFNLTKDRQWVFIANKKAGSMTTNSIAQKVASMVDAEALCHMIPIDLYINGHYRGSYCFTEKIGVSDNSVAIDETTGCLLELDSYYDEDKKFKDDSYNLPVNVKDPDFTEEDEERRVTFDGVKESFNNMTSALKNGEDITKHVDMESWAKFWLVNDLVRNVETYHPKSCYIFNNNPENGEKWTFGPVWDFDWAFGYEDSYKYFIAGAEEDLFENIYQNSVGCQFYNALRNTEAGKHAYYKEWTDFMKEGRLQELLEYIDDYTAFVQSTFAHNNYANIEDTDNSDYEMLAEKSKQWIETRANYIYNTVKQHVSEAVLIDGEEYENDTEQEVDFLTYNRTLPNMLWTPLYVPFKIPVASISDKYDVAYINGMHSYDRNDDGTIDNLTMEVIKIANGTLKANYPYLIKAKSEADMEMTIEQEGTVLYPSESTTLSCSSVYTRFDITGTYNEMTAEELDGSLVITSNGSWEQMVPGYTLKPYRLYLTITNSGDSPVEIDQEAMSRISISVLGEETGVSSIEKGHVEKQVIYNLHGTRVQNPTKGGVYIVNGKKVVK